MTPTCEAIKSPKDLDIANPGMSWFFSQTLGGPKGSPLKSLYDSTLPPLALILVSSDGSSGL
jgi:hypothetical protein